MPGQNSKDALAALREPLGESAPIARRLAAQYCDQRHPEGSCLLYHSAWQYFRLIGLIRTIASDDDFLGKALESLAVTGHFDRVLISGSADYGMLARVILAYRQVSREPRMTLVDICRTPLELNRWLAQSEDACLDTVHSDILGFTSEQPYDLICTHSFIGRFHQRRPALFRAWRGLLRPGGHIVTTTRIRPGMLDIVRFSPEEIEVFSSRALELAKNCRELGAVQPESVAEWAREYATRKSNYPLRSCEEITADFTQAGLRITTLDRTSGQMDRPSGASLDIPSERIRIIATRP